MNSLESLRKKGFKKKQEIAPSGRVGELVCNGCCNYYYESGSIKAEIYDDDNIKEELVNPEKDFELLDFLIKHKFTKTVYDIYSGENFLRRVEEGYIIPYDGTVLDIFVDGYISNIGFKTQKYSCGDFMLSKNDWEQFCAAHDVLVNFAHR